jgi:hypothetical protein
MPRILFLNVLSSGRTVKLTIKIKLQAKQNHLNKKKMKKINGITSLTLYKK